jgi:hypothetical protein
MDLYKLWNWLWDGKSYFSILGGKKNSLICFCGSCFNMSTLMLSSVSGDTVPQSASKLHWNTTDHISVTVGTYCCCEISSTYLHKRKWIIQKLSCTATKPCRFKLLMKCSQGITLLLHSLCYYPCKFSPYLCNRALHSALSYIKLSCPDVIFRLSIPPHFQLTPHRKHSMSQLLFSACQLFLLPQLISRREHCLHYQNHRHKCTDIYTWTAYILCPNYTKPECGRICW